MTARIRALAREFVRAEEGATLVEYALLVVLIGMVTAIAALTLGQAISNQFTKATGCFNTPSSTNCSPA
jgi:Flp pilus assembly pilin Flp